MNREHYNKLEQGVDVWNAYSRQQREIDENWYADLSGADLSGLDLSMVYLRGADLTDTNLFETNLHGANLWLAIFNDADIDKIPNFHRVKLGGYTCYIQPDWLQVGCWCGTPDELRNMTESEAIEIGGVPGKCWLRKFRETALKICEEMRG